MVKYKTLRRKRSLSKFKVGMVSLGCDKNRVDSELILGSINKFYEITNNPKDAEIIIINTCGFIESAKEEAINTILEMAEYLDDLWQKYFCNMQYYGLFNRNLVQ